MKLRAESLSRITCKMAPRTRIMKNRRIDSLAVWPFGGTQLFGMVTAYKMMELKLNLSLAAYLSARKDVFAKKEKISSSSPSSWLS